MNYILKVILILSIFLYESSIHALNYLSLNEKLKDNLAVKEDISEVIATEPYKQMDDRLLSIGDITTIANSANPIQRIVVASNSKGCFIIVWLDYGTPTCTVYGKIYYPNGSSSISQFTIGVVNSLNDPEVFVTALSNDFFLIIWSDKTTSTFGRIYRDDGTSIINTFQIPISGASSINQAIGINGYFIVMWYQSSVAQNYIVYKIYSNDGILKYENQKAITLRDSTGQYLSIAVLSDSKFIISWIETDMVCQVYSYQNDAVVEIGTNFHVADTNSITVESIKLISSLNGNFFAIWTILAPGGSTQSINTGRLNYTGQTQVTGFEITSNNVAKANSLAMTRIYHNLYAIIWKNDLNQIYCKIINGTGIVVIDNFLVYTLTGTAGIGVDIAPLWNGNFVVVLTDSLIAYGQIFDSHGNKIGFQNCIMNGLYIPGQGYQSSCLQVNISLQTSSSDPTLVYLQMEPKIQSFANNLNDYLTLSINQGAFTAYTYNITDAGTNKLLIKFAFTAYLSKESTLWCNFTIQNIIDQNNLYMINPMNISVNLLQYYPYSTNQITTIQNVQQAVSVTTTMSQVSTGVVAVTGFSSSNSFIIVQCIDLFSVVRYLNITYPPNIMSLFSQLQVQPVSLTFLPNVFSYIPRNGQDQERKISYNFAQYNVKLWIIDNFGGQLYQFIILIGCAIIFVAISKISKIKLSPNLGKILSKIKYFLVWNFIISFIISNYFTMVMFIFVQFTNIEDDTSYEIANLIINLICLIFLMLPLLTFGISLKYYKNLNAKKLECPPEFECLLSDYKHDNIIKIIFATLYTIRGLFVFGSLVLLTNNPLVTVIIWIVLCIIILLILIIYRPYNRMKGNINQIGCELFNLSYYISALLIMLINDDIEKKNNIGFVMLYINTALFVWITIFSIYDNLVLVYEIVKEFKKKARVYNVKQENKEDNRVKNDSSRMILDHSIRISPNDKNEDIPIYRFIQFNQDNTILKLPSNDNDNLGKSQLDKSKINEDLNESKSTFIIKDSVLKKKP